MRGSGRIAVRKTVGRALLLVVLACVFLSTAGMDFAFPTSKKVTFKLAKGRMEAGDTLYVRYQVNSQAIVPATKESTDSQYDIYSYTLPSFTSSATFLDFYIENGGKAWVPEHTINTSTGVITHTTAQNWGEPAASVAQTILTAVADNSSNEADTLKLTVKLKDAQGNPVTGLPYLMLSTRKTTFYTGGTSYYQFMNTTASNGELQLVVKNSDWKLTTPLGQLMQSIAWPQTTFGGGITIHTGDPYQLFDVPFTDILRNDSNQLQIGYAGMDSVNRVTESLQLPATGASGTTVTWSSNKPNVIASSGEVTRPPVGSGDSQVTLTATIAQGAASTTKTFLLTVKQRIVVPADINHATGKSPIEAGGPNTDATDGNSATYWTDTHNDNSFTIDFGEARTLKKWVIGQYGPTRYLQKLKFQTSDNNATWTDQDLVNAADGTTISRELAVPVTARYARVLILQSVGSPVSIRELEIWGEPLPNQSPTDITLTATTINEGEPAGTGIGTLGTTDPDQGDTFTYELVDTVSYPDNASFAIHNSNKLVTQSPFNFNQKNSYTIKVKSTDSGGLSYSKTFTITIIDVNDAPSISAVADVLVPLNTVGYTIPFTVSDAETPPEQLTVTADSSNTQVLPTSGLVLFGSGASRSLTLTPAAGATGVSTVTLTVADSELRTATTSFRVEVISVQVAVPGDQTLAKLSVGYASGSQETKTLTVANTGMAGLNQLTVVLGGPNADAFIATNPTATSLAGGESATFTIRAKDGLTTGTYSAKVSVNANNSTVATFTVTQLVAGRKGDFNGDGVLTPADALIITQYISGKITLTAEQIEQMDMNGDHVLNAEDARLILAIYLGGN